ncbi:MAG: dihydropteroate synthase [Nitrospirota bacterium]
MDHDARTLVMGILNATPDSYWAQSRVSSIQTAVEQARYWESAGADWIDVGGESTGPDSEDVSVEEELRRVIPVIEAVSRAVRIPVSIDTTKAAVARAAVVAGATMINDVSALRGDAAMADVAAASRASVILMYAKDDTPRTTRRAVCYDDVVSTVCEFLQGRIAHARSAGIADDRIWVDPGLGWFVGTDPRYSYEILAGLDRVRAAGFPVVVGPSRKSFLAHDGVHPPRPVSERLMPTAAAVAIAAWNGAAMVRVHDVPAMAQVVATVAAIKHPSRVDHPVGGYGV